jgi:AcrR family transcriptional regulator
MPRQSGTRQRIIDSFTEQLLALGYAGVSLDQIAAAVGIRKPSLYHHFPGGKEQICVEVTHRYIDASKGLLRDALSSGDGLRARLEAIVVVFATADSRLSLVGQRVYDATRHLSEEVRAEVSRRYCQALIDPVTALRAGAVERGELRPGDPGLLASAFLGLAAVAEPMPEDVAMPPDQRGDPGPGAEETARRLVDLFLRGAAPIPGEPG